MALNDGIIIIGNSSKKCPHCEEDLVAKGYEEYLSAVIHSFQSRDEVIIKFTKSQRKMDIANSIEKNLYPLGIRSRPREHTTERIGDKDIICEQQRLFKIPILKESLFS